MTKKSEQYRQKKVQKAFGKVVDQFPELTNGDISIRIVQMNDAHLSTFREKPGEWVIEVTPEVVAQTPTVLEGGLAHEVAHILEDSKRFSLLFFLDELLYDLWRAYRRRQERRIDQMVANRGLGTQLLAFLRWSDENYEKNDEGLTVEELEQQLSN